MKKWWLVLLLCGFVSASVDIHNSTVEGDYFLSEIFKGTINLTIEDERYDERIVSGNQIIELGDFLEKNGALFNCSPSDCSMGYEASSGVENGSFTIEFLEDKYVGFFLEGEDITLESISFNIESDFERGAFKPLIIEFFEEEEWSFNIFSDEFFAKNWGCYDPTNGEIGHILGPSLYCEMINIRDSGTIRVGADVYGDESIMIDMHVYPESGSGGSWSCEFNSTADDGCQIELTPGEIFDAGNYQVCITVDLVSDTRIHEEIGGDHCGFVHGANPEDSTMDYGIFLQTVKYADANELEPINFNEPIIIAANGIITEKHNGDCSEGCILPLKISGVSQNMEINNIHLSYTDDGNWDTSNLIYELASVSAEVDFSGVLDFSFLEFIVSQAGVFIIELGEIILSENIVKIIPAPVILSVSPLDPPAGVPIKFYTLINYSKNDSLSYKWDFGDNGSVVTNVPYITHTYNDLKNYTLSLEVTAGGNLSSKKTFQIQTISPEEAVAKNLDLKKDTIAKVKTIIEGFPSWYGASLLKTFGINSFEDDLERLDKERNNSVDAEDFRNIALELYTLNIPISVGIDNFEIPFMMTEPNDIKVEPVVVVSGAGTGSNDDYVSPILTWQNENIDVSLIKKDISILLVNGENKDAMTVYSFNIASKSDRESYFVINKAFSELYFNQNVGARKAGDATVIILGAGESKKIEFYYEGIEHVGTFISPKLSSLVIEANIDTDCNYNLVCEKEKGENVANCRSDCKPTGKAIMFLIFGVMFLLVVYTVLQVWYKKHYEGYLFKDKAQLYNLLMYVTNARARGVKDARIGADLRAKGWSSERVNYIIKKSKGSRIGIPEIIPIEKIAAYLRNRKARSKQTKKATTEIQQTNNGNINKSRF
ncbi:PKD domain-containing protein [archaeon]|nr:PKD domain-containing protein [archaeon]